MSAILLHLVHLLHRLLQQAMQQVQMLFEDELNPSVITEYLPAPQSTEFTRFTRTKVQLLTPVELRASRPGLWTYAASAYDSIRRLLARQHTIAYVRC
jgi:hypothetical protein